MFGFIYDGNFFYDGVWKGDCFFSHCCVIVINNRFMEIHNFGSE